MDNKKNKEKALNMWNEISANYPMERENMTAKQEQNFVKDVFNAYETEGFAEDFWSPYTTEKNRNGETYKVISRCTENDCDLEVLPMWKIQFEDGKIIGAYPEEIIEREQIYNGRII